METYKTFKSSNIQNKVDQFENQYGNRLIEVLVNNTMFFVEFCEDLEEMKEDFFFEFGISEDSKKAFDLILSFLNDDKSESIEDEIKNTKGNKVALLKLIASKFYNTIDRSDLKNQQPELYTELWRYNQVDFDISYINTEIALNARK